MRVICERCGGLDVHKDSVVACILKGKLGEAGVPEVRTFGATTRELLRLRDWLEAEQVTHVVMESTGVYWKPVFNILEGAAEVWLVNAQHVKNVPGRKTDVRDCEWLADLLRHGLIKPSFVPDAETRDLRELTRYRTQLIRDRASEANRIQKLLESANVKLGSVASDVLGVSGRIILKALAGGETDSQKLASMAKGRLAKKEEQLEVALEGRVRDHHRFMLKVLLDHVEELDRHIEAMDQEVEKRLRPFEEAIGKLDEVAGIGRRGAENMLAEIGTDMKRFPTAEHLASWAGMCPGNNQSGGKRLSGRTRKGSPWLRSMLVEAAWGAVRTKKSYFKAQYGRLKGRRGAKKAIVAVAHSILVVAYHLLQRGTSYQDLGVDYFDKLNEKQVVNRLKSRIESLGYEVQLKLKASA